MTESNKIKENGPGFDYQELKAVIDSADHVAVIPSRVSQADAFCAASGLYHMLIKKGKRVTFLYGGDIPEEAAREELIKPGEIVKDPSQRSLMVSIDYSEIPAAKVQYSTENNVLHLLVSPISKDFDTSRVKTSIAGFDFDLVFFLGVQHPENMGKTYHELREDINRAKIVDIDNTEMNAKFGSFNFVDATYDNLSLMVFSMASLIGLRPDAKSAKALLTGMTYREASN